MLRKPIVTIVASFAAVLVAAGAAPLLTPSVSSAAQQGWFWCTWDSETMKHIDFPSNTSGEELPSGPIYKSLAPQDKHSNDVPIGDNCWDGGTGESHTEYND